MTLLSILPCQYNPESDNGFYDSESWLMLLSIISKIIVSEWQLFGFARCVVKPGGLLEYLAEPAEKIGDGCACMNDLSFRLTHAARAEAECEAL